MCGIAGIHRIGDSRVTKIDQLSMELLRAIEMRGPHSTGIAALHDDGRCVIERDTMSATKFVIARRAAKRRLSNKARTVLLHTRFATVGTVNRDNAHPVVHGRHVAIHNGTIYNHRDVFRAIGRKPTVTVDSEVIPAVLEADGWAQATSALARLRGGAATAIITPDRPQELLLARLRDYPLVVMQTRGLVVWASTRHAIEDAWKRVYGRLPKDALWSVVPEFTLLHVNGTVAAMEIPQPKYPRPRPAVSNRKRKRQQRKQPPRKHVQLALSEPETSSDADVRELMRATGWGRAEAETFLALIMQDDWRAERDADRMVDDLLDGGWIARGMEAGASA